MTLTKESPRLAFIPLEASKSVKHCDGNCCTSVTERWGGERPFQEERIGREMNLLSHRSQVFLFIQSTFQFFSSHITLLDYQNCTSYTPTIELGHCKSMHICLMVGHLTNQTRFFPFTFYDSLCRQGLFTERAHVLLCYR